MKSQIWKGAAMLWCTAGAMLGASLAGAATPAAPNDEPVLEEVIVTGSRLGGTNLQSASPVQVFTAKDVEVSGKTDISDMINMLPQNFNNDMGQDLGNRTSGLTTAGGVATADLRGLGPGRTLVLVNGRRLGSGSPNTAIQSPAADLDQIPAAIIDHIDVQTGGASAVYGSDAIAGVVNFVLRKNVQGIELSGQVGENWHQNHNTEMQGLIRDFNSTPQAGSIRDGKNKAMNIVAGTSLPDGRGNITAYFTYMNNDPVASGDRDFGGCQLTGVTNAAGEVIGRKCTGSSNSNYFQAKSGPNVGTAYSVLGSALVPWGTPGTTPPQRFNTQPYIFMARQDVRYEAGLMFDDDVAEQFRPYGEFGFMNDRSHQAIAPSGLFRDSNPLDPAGNYSVNCSNPLLSLQEAAILCTPAQIAADAANPGSTSASIRIGRRNVEGGGRTSDFEHTNFRAVFGASGELGHGWKYDVYGQYYYTQFYNSNDQFLNFQSIANALQVTGTAANASCISGSPCVPYNIFKDGGVSQAALQYLYSPGTAYGATELKTVHADVTAELGSYGLILPTAREGLSVNVGFEHRRDSVRFRPDASEQSGLLSGFGGASVAINNGISVDEANIEVRAPLVQDRKGAQDLIVGAGYRTSDYSTGAGRVGTYKFDLQWAPIEGLRFRGSFNRAIRAPNNIELFNPQLVGQIGFPSDPCAPTTGAGGQVIAATATLAQCQRQGVTALQYGNGASTNTIPQGTAGQLSQLQGGNPNLKAESADTVTYGVVFQRPGARELFASVDYYRIRLRDTVGVLPVGLIMSNCLTSGAADYCSQIVRSPVTGGLTGATPQSGGYFLQTLNNVGTNNYSGVDFQVAHKVPVPFGSLMLTLGSNYLLHVQSTPVVGLPGYDCVGLYGPNCGTVNPRWHHNLRATWELPGGATFYATWRFLAPVTVDNDSTQSALQFGTFGAEDHVDHRIPSFGYLDLMGSWKGPGNLELRLGISNVLDKDPPLLISDLVAGGAANTISAYDMMGRQVFLAFKFKL
jgi:outer membrane receptor protein involved in Fe transport